MADSTNDDKMLPESDLGTPDVPVHDHQTAVDSLVAQDTLRVEGEDLSAVEQLQGRRTAHLAASILEAPGRRTIDLDLPPEIMHDFAVAEVESAGMTELAKQMAIDDTKAWQIAFPEKADIKLRVIREEYQNLRGTVAREATRQALQGNIFERLGRALEGNIIQRKFNEHMPEIVEGKDVQGFMGLAEVAGRPRQSLLTLYTGAGLKAAIAKLHPVTVLEERVDEEGVPEETTPWAATIDLAWKSSMLGYDTKEAEEQALVKLREVNMVAAQEQINFSDLPDAWFGTDNMDKFYQTMDEGGFWGKLSMVGLTGIYTAGDIYVDPLYLAHRLPSSIVQGLRWLGSYAQKARAAEAVALRSGNSLIKLQEAVDAATNLRKAAIRRVEKAAANGEDTTKPLKMLRAAQRLEDERVAALAEHQDDLTNVDMVHLLDMERRPGTAITTTEIVEEMDELAVKGAGRNWKPGERKTWRMGLEDDAAKGVELNKRAIDDGIGAFHLHNAKNVEISAVGKVACKGTNDHMVGLVESMGDKLGLRVIPYKSTTFKGKASRLLGQYHSGSRTAYVNVDQPPLAILGTFVHEAWHHVLSRTLSTADKQVLVANLRRAGFDLEKYGVTLGKNYPSRNVYNIMNEQTARATSEMMTDPKFWEVLQRLDPEVFNTIGSDAVESAMKMRAFMDNLGGRSPKSWYDGTMPPADMAEFLSQEEAWIRTQNQVVNAISRTAVDVGGRSMEKYKSVLDEVNRKLLQLVDERDVLERAGHDVKLNNKTIASMEKYRDRLEANGVEELLNYPRFKRRWQRTKTVDEVHAERQQERIDMANMQSSHVQPRVHPLVDEKAPLPELWDRVAGGADDAEAAGEGLARMAGGADPSDIRMHLNNVPERTAMTSGRIVPGTRENAIDMDKVGAYLKAIKDRAKLRQLSLAEYDPEVAALDKAYRRAMSKYADGKVPFDKSWLPAPRKTAGELAEELWNDTYRVNYYDRIADGLYPNTWALKMPALLRTPWMYNREPMRVMNAVDPGGWQILRGAMLNQENEMLLMNARFNDAFMDFGAITVKKPSTIRKALQTNAKEKIVVDKKKSRLLAEFLEVSPIDDPRKYDELMRELSPKQLVAAAKIRADLNQISRRFGFTGGELFERDYLPHVWDEGLFATGNTPPHLFGMSKNANLFMAHMLKRSGKEGYTKDAVAALEVYTRSAARKMHMEPALQRIRQRAVAIASDPNRQRDAFYLPYVDQMIAALRGDSSHLGALVDQLMEGASKSTGIGAYQRGGVSRSVMSVGGLMYTSLLAGNRRYPVMSVATGLATTGAQYGLFRTTKGMFQMATPEGQLIFKSMGGHKTWGRIFETDKSGGLKLLNKFTHGAADVHLASPSIQSTENFIRGMTFWASIDNHLRKMGYRTMQEAVQDGMANKIMFDSLIETEAVNHFFGIASKPPWMTRTSKSGAAIATQFLSFTPKQAEQLLSMAGDNPGKIAQFMMLSGWIARVGREELGVELSEYVGLESIALDSRKMVSPGIDALRKAINYQTEFTAVMEGHGNVEDCTRAGEEMLASLEVLVPLLNRARETADAAHATATGELWRPGQGKVRDLELHYMSIGGMEVPILGPHGDRGEAVALAMGIRSSAAAAHAEARKEANRQIGMLAVEKMELVDRALKAAKSKDWAKFDEQVDLMTEAGWPVPDVADRAVQQQSLEALSWHITMLRRHPEMAHKIIPILMRFGIIKTGEPNAQNQ
jgi:ribosomal protein S6E (S10)